MDGWEEECYAAFIAGENARAPRLARFKHGVFEKVNGLTECLLFFSRNF